MSLAKHLARQQQHLEAFITLLETERESLTEGRIDGQRLTQQAEEKQAQLALLESLEKQRQTAQRKLGYGEGQRGAEKAALDAGCLDAWQAFRKLAAHAKQLNQLNGVMISSRMTQNQRILDFLNEAAGKSLYGPDGQSQRQGLGGIASSA